MIDDYHIVNPLCNIHTCIEKQIVNKRISRNCYRMHIYYDISFQ